ncbi:MAG: TRAP transporter small permease subunit [Pseudomonadales bacterium]
MRTCRGTSNPVLELPHNRFSRWVDRLVIHIGEYVSWVWLLLLGIIVLNVLMRYLLSEGRIEFEEIQWHLYSLGFLLGLSYSYTRDAHVRVDVIRERLSPQTQAWIELYGTLFLLLPFIMLVVVASVPFIAYSFATSEVSQAPGGLPFRWLIKSVLLIGFLVLLLSVISRLSRVLYFLFARGSS